jgi:hypothetical protein
MFALVSSSFLLQLSDVHTDNEENDIKNNGAYPTDVFLQKIWV